ncbi:MAG: phosphate acetyltransferase, partial [Clostridia bacterium]|nr:phosphate acetyltransferase [Clostridia bacterium]
MNILEQIKVKAAALHKTIVLCEGEDSRVVKAAQDATKEGIAKIVLLGDIDQITAANPDIDLTGVEVINPLTSDKLPAYNAKLCELRASKGMTPEQASELLKDGTYFGAMMLKMGDVDGLVSGACHSTANTLRPGLQIVKTAPGYSAVSSFNLMICPPQGNQYCPDGLVVFADCGLNPTYTAEGLADCAIATARSAAAICGIDPKVAMLSFSSKGSAKHDNVTVVQQATA